MDKLKAMAAFVRIVERGSITAAADTLGVSAPALVRQLASLEAELGVRLVQRTTRRQSLTDEGREYYARCQQVLAAVAESEAAVRARRSAPRGRLRVTSSVAFGRAVLAPMVVDFMVAHPALHVELLLLDRMVDLVEEGVDVGVRLAPLPDSSLVAVPVGEVQRMVMAAPALLRRHPVADPGALQTAPCVSFSGLVGAGDWPLRVDGRVARVPVHTVFASNQIDAALAACMRGLGFAQFFDYQAEEAMRAGRLKPALAAYWPPPTPVQIVYPHARHLSGNVRAFVDAVAPRLRARLRRPGG